MLKLTNAFADKAIFVRPSEVMSVQQTDDCTLVALSSDVIHEVKEDAEAIVRYLVSKSDWNGNDKYDTIGVRDINKDETPNAFEDVDSAITYAVSFLNKQLEDEKNLNKKYYSELKERLVILGDRLVSVKLREVE